MSRTLERGPLSDASPSAIASSMVGRYRIVRFIGEGAMGTVYEAHDTDLERRVALKLLRVHEQGRPPLRVADATTMRLMLEARAMAQVSHPNVVSVFDVGVFDGEVFIAIEYIDGPTLRRWLSQTHRSWRQVFDVFLQAGQGRVALHRASTVHRDFKPDNVLILADGGARVTDFGLSRAAASDAPGLVGPAELNVDVGQSMSFFGGTPAYMAPEQTIGTESDPRSDIFSFCVTLFEALHGQRPFVGRTPEELQRNRLRSAFFVPASSRAFPAGSEASLSEGSTRCRNGASRTSKPSW